jgi:DNA-binding transcriptional LysR family regulator
MDLRHFRYFLAIAKTLNMRHASAELHIAQPALSQTLKQLEEDLGLLLFHRVHKRLSLTEAGKAFLPEALRAVEQFEAARVAAQRAVRGETGRLSIGFSSTASVTFLPQILRLFLKQYPDVELSLSELGYADQMSGLRSGSLDLSMLYATPQAGFCILTLDRQSLCAVLPAKHPLARRAAVSPADFGEDELVVLPSPEAGGTLLDAIHSEFALASRVPARVQYVNTIQTTLSLVSAGLGVSILPTPAQQLRRSGVVYRPLKHLAGQAPPVLTLHLAWHPKNGSSPLANFLRLVPHL